MREYLRAATIQDMDLLFEWANDAEVRRNSFSSELIPYEEHVQWYEKLLKSPMHRQYIYVCGDMPVGQVRIAIDGNNAEISYSIAPQYRGRGYGKRLLEALPEQVKKDFEQVAHLTGRVKIDNLASQQAFFKAGYREKCVVYEYDV